jgi:NTP pyrophosphatase (non-canonical NTP hydrolase)
VPASTDAITREEFITAVSRLAESVYDFHARFSIPNLNEKTATDDIFPRLCTRLAFLMEETGEHAKELNQGVLDRAVDEMADVAFVAMGTLLEMDSLGAIACREVANKNDKKTLHTHMVEPSSGKLIKRSQAK